LLQIYLCFVAKDSSARELGGPFSDTQMWSVTFRSDWKFMSEYGYRQRSLLV